MVVETLFIGLIIGFIFYEMTGISPGGVIAPGYFALYVHQPNKILMTIIIAFIVWGLLEVFSRNLIVYGRRKLLLALLLSFSLKLMLDQWIQPLQQLPFDLQSIGYIIPGLIANEMCRQRWIPTVSALAIVTAIVYFTLNILQPFI
jgi:poly-gamma-glutamate biosynthesis protein PgsC/CapC